MSLDPSKTLSEQAQNGSGLHFLENPVKWRPIVDALRSTWRVERSDPVGVVVAASRVVEVRPQHKGKNVTDILDPDLMRTLLIVSEEASFTRASEALGLTQQAVSAQIKRLEKAVGGRVVERHGQGARLTPDGEALVSYARQMTKIMDKVRRHFSKIPTTGVVRVGIIEGFASGGLPSILAALRIAQPNLVVIVETAPTDSLIVQMDNGRFDAILGAQRRGQSRGEKLWIDEMRWFGDLSYFADPQTSIRLVLPPKPSLSRMIAVDALTRAGRPFEVLFESSSRVSLRAAAVAGLGVTVFSKILDDDPLPEEHASLPELESLEFFLRVDRPYDEKNRLFSDLINEFVHDVLRKHSSSF